MKFNTTAILDAIRGNPLTVVCGLVILVSLISFYWPTYVWSAALQARMSDRNAQLRQLQSFKQTEAVFPPSDPDNPPTREQMLINQAAINKLESVYKDLESEYRGIFEAAVEHNRTGHEPMLAGLFPQPINAGKPFEARDAYRQAFVKMYDALDAGTPPSKERRQQALDRERQALRRSYLIREDEQLSAEQKAELKRRQADRLVELYRQEAAQHHVYAEPVVLNVRTGQWQPGVFQVGEWARAGPKPLMDDVWEGQLQLWIQQDLVKAIRLANNADEQGTSLLQQPVKRIRSMFVKSGYVGVPEGGKLRQVPDEESVNEIIQQQREMLNTKLPDDFSASPTGRVSNPLYDVRHAVLSVIIDSQRIPALLNALGRVNFMTVIGTDVTDVDEYEALRNGYYYGRGDMVQMDLTVETLWLRRWTTGHLSKQMADNQNQQFDSGLMPEIVRFHLGLPPRDRRVLRQQLQEASGSNNRQRRSSSSR